MPRQKARGRGKDEAAKKLPRGVSRKGNCLEDYITVAMVLVYLYVVLRNSFRTPRKSVQNEH